MPTLVEIRIVLAIMAIALTGYAHAEDRVRALVAGFQAHLAKPVMPEELFRTIRRLAGAERVSAQRSKA